MKKITLTLLICILSLVTFSQDWYGNNPTFTTGTYNVDYTGTATITGNVIFTNGGSLSTVDIKSGGSLTLQSTVEFFNGSIVENGGSLIALQDVKLDNANTFFDNVSVAGTLEINNQGVTLATCSFLKVKNLLIHQDNVFSGSGLIWITGNYDSEAGSNFHPLTSNNTIHVNYSGTWAGFGAAQQTGNTTSICSTVTPVTILNVDAKLKNGVLNFSFTSSIESNNNYFSIEGSTDGRNFVEIGRVNSFWTGGNSSTEHDYLFTFDDIQVTEASIGGLFATLLFLGLVVGFVKSKRMKVITTYAGMILLSLGAFSCHKTNDVKVNTTYKYTYVRFKSVDLDGTLHYYQRVFKIA